MTTTRARNSRMSVEIAPRHLAEQGQRVMVIDDGERVPELSAEERQQTYIVLEHIGEGEDQFVRLASDDPVPQTVGWFRTTQLRPAPAETPVAAGSAAAACVIACRHEKFLVRTSSVASVNR